MSTKSTRAKAYYTLFGAKRIFIVFKKIFIL